MDSKLNVRIEEKENVVIAKLEGSLDISTLSIFEEKIEDFAKQDYKHIILDFSETNYLDSSGLGSIVKLYQILKKGGKRLSVLLEPEPETTIMDLFHITKLDKYIKLYKSVEEATKAQEE